MRLEMGLTQREVAEPHLTRAFISQIENGLVMPSLTSLRVIAAKLGKPVDWFFEKFSEEELNRPLANPVASIESDQSRANVYVKRLRVFSPIPI